MATNDNSASIVCPNRVPQKGKPVLVFTKEDKDRRDSTPAPAVYVMNADLDHQTIPATGMNEAVFIKCAETLKDVLKQRDASDFAE